MIPMHNNFDELLAAVNPKGSLYKFMTGVLLVDATSEIAQAGLLQHINDYNLNSGRVIDFYMPGYVKDSNYDDSIGHISAEINIDGYRYFFIRELFESAVDEYKRLFNIDYKNVPLLILMDVEKGSDDRFQVMDSLVIDLGKTIDDIRMTDRLFNYIFTYARENTRMNPNFRVKYKVMLGKNTRNIGRYLKEQFTDYMFQETIAAAVGGVVTYISLFF